MPRRALYVLLPTGSKAEVQEARRLLGGDDVDLRVGTAAAHTPGQTLYGDVIVVGDHLKGVAEADATGQVQRVKDMGALAALKRDARGGAAPAPTAAAPAPGGAPGQEPSLSDVKPNFEAAKAEIKELQEQPSPEDPKQANGPLPDLEHMPRDKLILLAAERLGKGRWVTMPAGEIRKKLVEHEARRG